MKKIIKIIMMVIELLNKNNIVVLIYKYSIINIEYFEYYIEISNMELMKYLWCINIEYL